MKCDNGNQNIWSIRPIKCRVPNHQDLPNYDETKPTIHKWKPDTVSDVDTLCDEKEVCGNIREKYNLSEKLLSWKKTKINDLSFDLTLG